MGQPANVPGALVVRRTNSDVINFFVTPDIRNKRYVGGRCIATVRGVVVARPNTRTRNETQPSFLGPETRRKFRCCGQLDPRRFVVGPKPRTRNDTSCFWAVYTQGLRPQLSRLESTVDLGP